VKYRHLSLRAKFTYFYLMGIMALYIPANEGASVSSTCSVKSAISHIMLAQIELLSLVLNLRFLKQQGQVSYAICSYCHRPTLSINDKLPIP
jgi:hypothetical protein